MSSNVEFILVTQNEYEIRKNEVVLTSLEGEKIVENSEAFIKLLKKAKFNYQLELSRGTHKGREQVLYDKMDAMDDVIKSIESVEEGFKKFNQQPLS